MALLKGIFKKKEEEKKSLKSKEKPLAKPKAKKEEKAPKAETKQQAKTEKAHEAWRVLEAAHITEKAAFLAENNKYVFKIKDRATKMEVKKAVEGLFNVKVTKINLITIPKKKKRLGRVEGWKKGYRKAVVALVKGQSIELLPR